MYVKKQSVQCRDIFMIGEILISIILNKQKKKKMIQKNLTKAKTLLKTVCRGSH